MELHYENPIRDAIFNASSSEEVDMLRTLHNFKTDPILGYSYRTFNGILSKFGFTWFSSKIGKMVPAPKRFEYGLSIVQPCTQILNCPEKVLGGFYINGTRLQNLLGAPKRIISGNVALYSMNSLISLEGMPECKQIEIYECPNLVHVDFPSVRKCKRLNLYFAEKVDPQEIENLRTAGVKVIVVQNKLNRE